MGETVRIDDEFEEVATHTVDDRKRVTLGGLLKDTRRVRIYKNNRGEFFLQPLTEIPAAEAWLFQNREALQAVQKGLEDASAGRVSRLDLDEL
ncbi:MAG: hypothetical protein HOC74_09145 [Gemmatimonadetes bacterium]|jgi:hypothetical protein|nr:hypothetical protein [Gemmatimonadota bacterium]